MRRIALAIPFFLGILGVRASVPALGDSLARVLLKIVSAASFGGASQEEEAPAGELLDPSPSDEDAPDSGARPAPHRRTSPDRASRRDDDEDLAPGAEGQPARYAAPRGTVVIPAVLVTRALERRDVGATNARSAAGEAIGARLHGVGKYGVGLRDGDIVMSVQGAPTPTVSAMTSAALEAASGGATRLTGEVRRGNATFSVVLEVPR